jgi:hypothetical protein
MTDVPVTGWGFAEADQNTPITGPGGAIGDALGGISDSIFGNEDTTLSQSKYDFNYKVFPNDLGMDYLGHYMVININVPVIPFTNNPRGSDVVTSQFDVLANEKSKVDVLRYGANAQANAPGAETGTGLPRRTTRIAQSIALYMPGTQMIYNGRNTYEEVGLTALGGQLLTGVLSAGAGVLYGLLTRRIDGAGDAASGAGKILDGAGNAIGTAAGLAGAPINPRVEVLFSMTPLRDFQFEFLMVPRNQEEAKTIREIVRTLRFHAAPELDAMTFGNTFIPPAEFDITFYHRGVENLSVPRINTCVLLELEVDYAPGTGIWQTYRDGSPLATRLRLVFKEVEVVHKLRVLQGF